MRRTMILTLVLGLFISLTATAHEIGKTKATPKKWTYLGSKSVSWRVDRDVLKVGAQDGTFSKLKIKVTGGAVNMTRMVVTYGNGSKDVIPLKHNFKRGATSRTIDLDGNRRVIKNITFIYDRQNIARRAKVWVSGR